MTPTTVLAAPLHPWARIARPVAALAFGGGAMYAGMRATDSDRSALDRTLSGVVGAGAVLGAAALGFRLGDRGVRIGQQAMSAARTGADDIAQAWPKGTAIVTRGSGTWRITPHEAIGDSIAAGALGGGIVGGAGGAILGTYLDGLQHGRSTLDYIAGPEGQRSAE